MNRRAFLTRLAAATAGTAIAATVDWDRLLWTPGATHYVDLWTPPPTLLAGDLITFDGDGTVFRVCDASGRITHEFVTALKDKMRLLDRHGVGKIGVVTGAVVSGGFAQVQTYGPTTVRCVETETGLAGVSLDHPWVA